jgi:asparagine synthase (glutamine-hydrolysing)
VRVLLDGLDGDTTVSHGVAHLAALARSMRFGRLISETRALSQRFGRPARHILWHHVISRLAAQRVRRVWRTARRLARGPGFGIIRPDFARRVGLAARVSSLRPQSARPAVSARDDHARRLDAGIIPYSLEVVGRTAAAFGIEPRHPFFDARLAEYCLALPPEQKIRGGWTRLVMRRGLDGVLPGPVQWRGGKALMGSNFNHGLLAFERERLQRLMSSQHSLRRAFRRYVRRPNHRDGIALWQAASLDEWLRIGGIST